MKANLAVLCLAVVGVFASVPTHAAPFTPTPSSVSILAQATDITDMAQEFITELAEEKYAVAVQKYDSELRESVTPQTLEDEWTDMIAKTGAFENIVNVEVDTVDNSQIAVVTCEFENATIDILVIFNTDGNVTAFNYPDEI
jgi:hypothetical protein